MFGDRGISHLGGGNKDDQNLRRIQVFCFGKGVFSAISALFRRKVMSLDDKFFPINPKISGAQVI